MTSKKRAGIVIVVGIFLFATGAFAQQDKVAAQVPFEFAANGKKLPAGAYTMGRATADQPTTLELRNADSSGAVVFALADFNGHDKGEELVFHRYGGRYFLREVRTPLGRHVLGESKEESRLAQGTQPSVVAIAAGRR